MLRSSLTIQVPLDLTCMHRRRWLRRLARAASGSTRRGLALLLPLLLYSVASPQTTAARRAQSRARGTPRWGNALVEQLCLRRSPPDTGSEGGGQGVRAKSKQTSPPAPASFVHGKRAAYKRNGGQRGPARRSPRTVQSGHDATMSVADGLHLRSHRHDGKSAVCSCSLLRPRPRK